VSALVDARWLDPHPTARLAVHGRAEHADHTTLQKLSRVGKKPIQSNHTDAPKVCDQPETTGINLIARPLPLPEPIPEPEPEPAPRTSAPLAVIHPIRLRERTLPKSGILRATWDAFRNRYAESGKPLNETDWNKAGMEAATLDLSKSDMTDSVMPALAAELPGWAERDVAMIPFPANWLKSQSWTRKAIPRAAPLTREQRRQAEIDREWKELGNGTGEGQL